jgi:ketosteroid isomerase-like protein
VQQAYQRIHAGGMASFLTLLADDVQWKVPAMANVPFAGTWQGRAQVGEFFRNVAASQEQGQFVPEHFIAQGHKLITLATVSSASSAWLAGVTLDVAGGKVML